MPRFTLTCFGISFLLLLLPVATPTAHAQLATTEGEQFLYLSTQGTDEVDSGVDRTGDGSNENDIAVYEFTFSASQDQAISLDYNFLTGELLQGPMFADAFEISLNGTSLVSGAASANGTFDALFGFDSVMYLGPNFSFFADGQLGFQNIAATTVGGTNILEFFVGDEGDFFVDSALLVDNILLDNVLLEGFESIAANLQPTSGTFIGSVTIEENAGFTVFVPEPSSLAMLAFASIGLAVRRKR